LGQLLLETHQLKVDSAVSQRNGATHEISGKLENRPKNNPQTKQIFIERGAVNLLRKYERFLVIFFAC
jgi:hypothetical protein